MPSTVRYTPAEDVLSIPYLNSAPVEFLDFEVMTDHFISSRIVKFRLKNNTLRIIDSAVVTLRFYKHFQGSRILVAKKDELVVAYYGLMIRPGDIFGNDTEISFPPCGADEVEYGVTRIYVREYPDAAEASENAPQTQGKQAVFSDQSGFAQLNAGPRENGEEGFQPRSDGAFLSGGEDEEEGADESGDEEKRAPLAVRIGVPALILLAALLALFFFFRN